MGGSRYAARKALGMACGQKSYKILQKISGKSKSLFYKIHRPVGWIIGLKGFIILVKSEEFPRGRDWNGLRPEICQKSKRKSVKNN